MPTLQDLVSYCDERTRRLAFKDYPGARNGLQLANSGRVTKIGAAVDAGLLPFKSAVERGIDFLILHHGMFWSMPRPFVGPFYESLATLIRGDCAVYSSHLPLDAHREIGNNALLARQLGLTVEIPFLPKEDEPIAWIAPNPDQTRQEIRQRLDALYPHVTAIEYGSEKPAAIAFCSGSGNSAIPCMPAENCDTLVTGELREEWFNVAQEQKLNIYICGHYATEVHGVCALAAELAEKFKLSWEFIPTGNPL